MHWDNCAVVSIVCSVSEAQAQQLISSLRQSTTSVLSLMLNIIKFCYDCFGVSLFCWIGGLIYRLSFSGSWTWYISQLHLKVLSVTLGTNTTFSKHYRVVWAPPLHGLEMFLVYNLSSHWLEPLGVHWGPGRLKTVYACFSELLWTVTVTKSSCMLCACVCVCV